jgi:hypothetical protein
MYQRSIAACAVRVYLARENDPEGCIVVCPGGWASRRLGPGSAGLAGVRVPKAGVHAAGTL